jgi:hypothetical protein
VRIGAGSGRWVLFLIVNNEWWSRLDRVTPNSARSVTILWSTRLLSPGTNAVAGMEVGPSTEEATFELPEGARPAFTD